LSTINMEARVAIALQASMIMADMREAVAPKPMILNKIGA